MKSKKKRTPKHFWIYAWRDMHGRWLPCNSHGSICTEGAYHSVSTDVLIEFTKKAAQEKAPSRRGRHWKFIKISLED